MRRTYLALIAITFGLLTLACSGAGSNIVGPTVTGSSQMSAGSGVVGAPGGPQVQAQDASGQEIEPVN